MDVFSAITHLGGTDEAGARWYDTRMAVVQAIKDGHSFYTRTNSQVAWLGVRKNEHGTEYVQTYADGQWSNNLLSLAECPV